MNTKMLEWLNYRLQDFDKRDKKSTDDLPAYTLFPAKGYQIAWKSQVK
jgi:hypothetical protein